MEKLKKITTVDHLVEALKNNTGKHSYLQIVKAVDIPLREFERYFSWNKDHYTRNCLFKNDDVELLLICWEKGQKSAIHDFNSNAAWVHPIKGKLTEERFLQTDEGLEKVSSVILDTSCFSFMANHVIMHRYINTYESRSVCLNLYSKPLTCWNEHDEVTGAITEKKIGYDTEFNLG